MSIGKKLVGLLKGVAPGIATAIGGPLGGVAMKFLADKFTDGDTGSVEDFLLSANPETLKELKVAEMEFDSHMRELDVDIERLNAADRDSARDLAKKTSILPQVILSTLFIVGYFSLMYLFFTSDLVNQLNDFAKGQLGIMIGVLTAAIAQIMNFWFGSSSGSKQKTEALAKARGA